MGPPAPGVYSRQRTLSITNRKRENGLARTLGMALCDVGQGTNIPLAADVVGTSYVPRIYAGFERRGYARSGINGARGNMLRVDPTLMSRLAGDVARHSTLAGAGDPSDRRS